MISVGIDCGLHGAVVAVDCNHVVVAWADTPIIKDKTTGKNDYLPQDMRRFLFDLIARFDVSDLMVWIEKAQAMPKQGVSSTFKTGRGFGLWEGICVGLGLRYDFVSPRVWAKEMTQDMPGADPKARSVIKCQRLLLDLPLTDAGRKTIHDGRADAGLIACYGLVRTCGVLHEKKI